MSIDDMVLGDKESGGIKDWMPEDFNFTPRDGDRAVFYKGRYELRRMQYNKWLMRKKVKNKNGNSEMVVKWGMIVINPSENKFATMLFSLGLR